MSKYEPLGRMLAAHGKPRWSGRFADIERVLASPLPESARRHRPWWANQSGRGHVQAHAWMDKGWRVDRVDLHREEIEFIRHPEADSGRAPAPGSNDLFGRAAALTGINDRNSLIDLALEALIQRETASKLFGLGGTMPDAAAPDRRRPA